MILSRATAAINGGRLATRRKRLYLRSTSLSGSVNQMANLKITVNRSRCIGSGDCTETAPTVFQLDGDGKSEVINPTGAGDQNILAAARSCPVKAITVVDESTGEHLFPPAKR
jgi:ferredoxin